MLTRIKLPGYSLFISWALNTLGEFIGRLIWGSGDRFPGLALLTAPVYLGTLIFFGIPIAACSRAASQLRFWYLMLLASVAWTILPIVLIFHASLKDFLGPWPSLAFPLWFSECALSSMTIYLLLLRSAVRRTADISRTNLAT